jgi:hypothetical protein
MRLLIPLMLSMVSLFADTMGVNATKIPPVRKQSTVRHAAPRGASTPTMRMPSAKHDAKKGTSKTPVQKVGAVARAVSGKASRSGIKAALPSHLK